MKKLVIYDFDKTLYNGDSTVNFWKYSIKKNPFTLIFFPYQLILFFLYCLGLITTKKLKENFMKHWDYKNLDKNVKDFWNKEYKNIFPWVKNELKKDINNKNFVICISASPEFLIKPICKKIGFFDMVIATKTHKNKIIGKNCKSCEKVSRLKKLLNKNKIKKYTVIKMTSDSKVDLPLYKIAKEHYKVEKGKLLKGIAK